MSSFVVQGMSGLSFIITHSGIIEPKFNCVEMYMCRAFQYVKLCSCVFVLTVHLVFTLRVHK